MKIAHTREIPIRPGKNDTSKKPKKEDFQAFYLDGNRTNNGKTNRQPSTEWNAEWGEMSKPGNSDKSRATSLETVYESEQWVIKRLTTPESQLN